MCKPCFADKLIWKVFAMAKYSFKNPRLSIRGILAFASLMVTSPVAYADAIDGDWCDKSGRHLSIDGPNIKTPNGKVTTGNYDRHGFFYKPATGENANKTVQMQLLSDDLMEMTLPNGATQNWRRCEVVS